MLMKKSTILNRRFRDTTYKNVTLKLVIINVLVYLVTSMVYPRLTYYIAMIPSLVLRGYLWQPFTYMFVHGGFSHLLFNMLSLFIFGSMVERRIGSKEFLLFYLLTGLFSGIISFFSYYLAGTNVILVGASGAIYGVLLMFAVFYPYSVIFVFGLIPPIRLRFWSFSMRSLNSPVMFLALEEMLHTSLTSVVWCLVIYTVGFG